MGDAKAKIAEPVARRDEATARRAAANGGIAAGLAFIATPISAQVPGLPTLQNAFGNPGIAIAANSPMMATTIMISTSVKAAFLPVLIVISDLTAFFRTRGLNDA